MCLLFLSTLLDYVYGFFVASPTRSKARFFLWLSVLNNLGILAVFKYYNFFALQLQNVFAALGFHVEPLLLSIVLPIGISFYTFHGMSYVFDIYNGKQKPVSNFIEYAVFVSFFPLLVAGPIERANHLLPQIQRCRVFSYSCAVEGCRLILWGMFKKVVIADGLAGYVDNIFDNYLEYNGITLVVGAIAFSIQIYGDFSGYSDIALGTAKLFGFELLSNFRFPYFSRDIAEFWRRWHISLSSWFKDYLYIPLGGSRRGIGKAVVNTFIIFIVSGFWHGANWKYIVWGAIHAFGFLPLLLLGQNRTNVNTIVAADKQLPSLKEAIQIIGTFAFVTFAWIFFRADGIPHALSYLKHMIVNLNEKPEGIFSLSSGASRSLLTIGSVLILDWYFRKDERKLRVPRSVPLRLFAYWAILLIILMRISTSQSESFIYFQF